MTQQSNAAQHPYSLFTCFHWQCAPVLSPILPPQFQIPRDLLTDDSQPCASPEKRTSILMGYNQIIKLEEQLHYSDRIVYKDRTQSISVLHIIGGDSPLDHIYLLFILYEEFGYVFLISPNGQIQRCPPIIIN